jgi:hypothetical protein
VPVYFSIALLGVPPAALRGDGAAATANSRALTAALAAAGSAASDDVAVLTVVTSYVSPPLRRKALAAAAAPEAALVVACADAAQADARIAALTTALAQPAAALVAALRNAAAAFAPLTHVVVTLAPGLQVGPLASDAQAPPPLAAGPGAQSTPTAPPASTVQAVRGGKGSGAVIGASVGAVGGSLLLGTAGLFALRHRRSQQALSGAARSSDAGDIDDEADAAPDSGSGRVRRRSSVRSMAASEETEPLTPGSAHSLQRTLSMNRDGALSPSFGRSSLTRRTSVYVELGDSDGGGSPDATAGSL